MEKRKNTSEVYGVEMTPIEEMEFSKYRDLNSIAMNTLTKSQRFELTSNWIIEKRK